MLFRPRWGGDEPILGPFEGPCSCHRLCRWSLTVLTVFKVHPTESSLVRAIEYLEGISKPEPNALASGTVRFCAGIHGPAASADGSHANQQPVLKCPLGLQMSKIVNSVLSHRLCQPFSRVCLFDSMGEPNESRNRVCNCKARGFLAARFPSQACRVGLRNGSEAARRWGRCSR